MRNTNAMAIVLLGAFSGFSLAGEYRNQQEFLAELSGGQHIITFDNLAHGTIVGEQGSGTLWVSFLETGRVWNEQDNPSGGSWKSPPNVLWNWNPPGPIKFCFRRPVDGVGFYNASIADRERVKLFDKDGQMLFEGQLSENSVNFLGYITDGNPIARGEVVGIPPETFGTIFIDDFSFGFRTIRCYLPADLVNDGVLNTLDFGLLATCFAGPGVPSSNCPQGSCGLSLIDGDDDVDLHDFAVFQRSLGSSCQ